jgi:hypothetical protein
VLITPEEKEQLELKTVSFGILIKFAQKRIVFCLLQEGLAIYPFGEFNG